MWGRKTVNGKRTVQPVTCMARPTRERRTKKNDRDRADRETRSSQYVSYGKTATERPQSARGGAGPRKEKKGERAQGVGGKAKGARSGGKDNVRSAGAAPGDVTGRTPRKGRARGLGNQSPDQKDPKKTAKRERQRTPRKIPPSNQHPSNKCVLQRGCD